MGEKLLRAFLLIIIMLAAFWLTIIIHEAGHFCMGKASGYRMASFRVGSFMFYRQEGRWKVTSQTISGTLGQCTMVPPESAEPEKVPCLLYHLGGGLFNVLTVLFCVPFLFIASGRYGKAFFTFMAMFSLAFALFNLFPSKTKVQNDGYNARLAMQSPQDRRAMYHILRVTGNLELSPGEMPEEDFVVEEEGEYRSVMKLLKGYRYLDLGNLGMAKTLFAECASERGVADYYRLEAEKERLFCLLLLGAPEEELNACCTQELMQYLKDTQKNSAGSCRVLYAYGHLHAGDLDLAQKSYERAKSLLQRASAGDRKMEERLLGLVAEGRSSNQEAYTRSDN